MLRVGLGDHAEGSGWEIGLGDRAGESVHPFLIGPLSPSVAARRLKGELER